VDIELRMIVGWWYTTRRSANDAEALARAEAWFSSLPAYSKAFEGSSASSVKQSSPLSAIVGKLRREPGTAPAEKDMPTAKTVDPRVAWERQHVYRRMARVCLALLKARKKAGRIPAQLPDLGDTSTDPYTGAPFGFYRQFEGFAIYASSASTQMNTARVQMRSDLSFSEKDTNPPEGYYMR
jgi:hypothetical protein